MVIFIFIKLHYKNWINFMKATIFFPEHIFNFWASLALKVSWCLFLNEIVKIQKYFLNGKVLYYIYF